MKTTLAIAISFCTIHAVAGPLGQGTALDNVKAINVTGANGGRDGGQDRNREELAIAVIDASGPVASTKCTLSNDKGDWSVTAPDTVSVRRSSGDLKVHCEKPGYDPVESVLKASTTQITPKHFRFSTDAGGDGSDEEESLITVPQYGPSITVTMNAKAGAAQ